MYPGPRNQQNSPFDTTTVPMWSVAQSPANVRLDFIRKTYVLFFASILFAIVGGAVCLTTGFGSVVLHSGFIGLIAVFGLCFLAQAVSRIEGLNYLALFGFTFVMGAFIAPVVALYGPDLAGQAALITGVVFGSLTAYTFISRQDFNYMGGMLFVGLISLVVCSLANAFFFHSMAASYWMAWIIVLLFSGFVLYDTSRIINRYDEKAYCSAALALFLDFLNLFLAILRILGGNRR